ncbi:hypothetical protein FF38_00182 [Lucilia cuprina]|uniref:Uncharacterized protein n=1 Tax=Lucilia cuprina TaxID=7375 RepID=A0A0L0BRE3_LUCCU|nr:hypothetical protein FF38_00182 [Lucilia cuprina]
MLATTTKEKASLISHIATSSFLMPAFSNNLGIAKAGAMGKSIGSVSASWKATTRAKGFKFIWAALSAVIKTKAEPPSFKVEALPAVTVPFSFWKTVDNLPNLSKLTRLYSSSSATITSALRFC